MTLRGKMVEGRWFEEVKAALPDGEVVFSTGTDDYQGSVAIVARLDDGRWLHYDWSYGSCSGCDAWESRVHGGEEGGREAVLEEIRNGAAILDAAHFADYLVGCRAAKASWLRDPDSSEQPFYSYETHVGMTVDELVRAVSS